MKTTTGDQMTRSAPPAHLTTQFIPATEPQVNYVKALAEQKELGEHAEWMAGIVKLADAGKMDKRFATKLIGRLREMPSKAIDHSKTLNDITGEHGQQMQPMLWSFPAGRYALVKADDDDNLNPIEFYHVKIGREGGKWAGYYFVSRMASDEEYPVRNKQQRTRVLNAIADNPLEAAQRYGREFKCCAICGKGLTRRLSRVMGIGPTCAEKVGMPHEHIEQFKSEIVAAGLDPEETIS
jgi:hypothetical protein